MSTIKVMASTALLSFSFSTVAQNVVTQAEDVSNDLGDVDLNDGISRKQANVMANYYCHLYVPGCGAVSEAKSVHARWEVSVETGIAARLHADAIYIEKHTGRASWGSGPSIFLRDVMGSPRPAPKPLNATLKALSGDDAASAMKIQFSVLPSGSTANHHFLRSSGDVKCDLSARRSVESGRFPPREAQVTLVASSKRCMADGAGRSHPR